MNDKNVKKGLAGLIVVILVLGFLMAVSTSTVLLLRTEKQGIASSNENEQALTAAQSGIYFYMGLLAATSTTFLTTPANCRTRLHFLSNTTRNVVNVAGQQVATYSGAAPAATYTTVATSAWMFASGTTLFSNSLEPPDFASGPIFMIKTYADEGTLASYVYIKSLGVFRVIENNTAVASYYAQINARLEIVPSKKIVRIDRIRKMRVEYPSAATSSFHSSIVKAWK